MWVDDVSLMLLEETDWTISNVLNELPATVRDEEFLGDDRFMDFLSPVE